MLFTSSVSAVSYYVDPSGNNSNTGTSESTPWQNFANINSRILQPGDQVLLKRGGVWQQSSAASIDQNLTLTINGKGTITDFIEIGAYGVGPRPKICGLPLTQMNNLAFISYRPMRINNPSYLSVSSLEVCNGGAGIVVFYDRNYSNQAVYLDDILAHDFYGIYEWSGASSNQSAWRNYQAADQVNFSAGIIVTGNDTNNDNRRTVLTDFRVTNSEIYKTGAGITLGSAQGTIPEAEKTRQAIIDNVYLHDNDHGDVALTSIFLFHCTDCQVKNTYIDQGAGAAPRGTAVIHLANNFRVTIENVTVKNTPNTWAPDNSAVDLESQVNTATVLNSWFENNAGPGMEFFHNTLYSTNIEIKNNVFIGNNWARKLTPNASQVHISSWPDPDTGRHTGSVHDNRYQNASQTQFFGGDGNVSGFTQINNVVGVPARLSGDVYFDWLINGKDARELLAKWQTELGRVFDVKFDRKINSFDMVYLVRDWTN